MSDPQPTWQFLEHGIVCVAGADALSWLDNLVTNDLTGLADGAATFAALLSPQGKILFEFYVVRRGGDLLLDTTQGTAPALAKRLSLYKLRARVEITDQTPQWSVVCAHRDAAGREPPKLDAGLIYPHPRAPSAIWRGLAPARNEGPMLPPWEIAAANVTLGLPEAPFDYALGDTFPHEANYDLLGGVSFTKGCFIGQEVVSRMQNKAVVRRRVVRVHSQVPLISGSDITAGDAVIGKVGTVYHKNALAMVRLDRAAEAQDKGQVLHAGLHALEVDVAALAAYRQSAANRPVIDL